MDERQARRWERCVRILTGCLLIQAICLLVNGFLLGWRLGWWAR